MYSIARNARTVAHIALLGLAHERLLKLREGGGAVLDVFLQVARLALGLLLQVVDLACVYYRLTKTNVRKYRK